MEKFKVTIDKDFQEIIPPFIDNRHKDIEQIQDLLNVNDLIAIMAIAHKLAGNAGSYGFTKLGEIGAQMEKSCEAGDEEEVKNLFQEFKNYMDNLEIVYE